MAPYVLWGTPGSLYTGKLRSYLRKARIDYVERAVGLPEFRAVVAPAVGRWIMPVLQLPDGSYLQDGAAIIDHFEAVAPVLGETGVIGVIAALFELYGGEGMVRAAMHYRWNFDDENLAFLAADFGGTLVSGDAAARAAIFADSSGRMRTATQIFGVNPSTYAAVEAGYARFLALLDAHLDAQPYLLGGRPTRGDFGLIGPLYAHLGRDPAPARRMKASAWRVWRWVERMNVRDDDAGEYGDFAPVLLADDSIPDTLTALLAFVAEDYLGEVAAMVGFTNRWLAEHPEATQGSIINGRASKRIIGMTSFDWHGTPLTAGVMPYRLWLLQRVQDAADALAGDARARLDALFAATGLAPLLALRTDRRVERGDNCEIWGKEASR